MQRSSAAHRDGVAQQCNGLEGGRECALFRPAGRVRHRGHAHRLEPIRRPSNSIACADVPSVGSKGVRRITRHHPRFTSLLPTESWTLADGPVLDDDDGAVRPPPVPLVRSSLLLSAILEGARPPQARRGKRVRSRNRISHAAAPKRCCLRKGLGPSRIQHGYWVEGSFAVSCRPHPLRASVRYLRDIIMDGPGTPPKSRKRLLWPRNPVWVPPSWEGGRCVRRGDWREIGAQIISMAGEAETKRQAERETSHTPLMPVGLPTARDALVAGEDQSWRPPSTRRASASCIHAAQRQFVAPSSVALPWYALRQAAGGARGIERWASAGVRRRRIVATAR